MTPPAPSRDSVGGRAYNDLRNLARRRGREPTEYFTLYALEGFLTRLAASEYAEDLVLKGGVLMAAFAVRRPTRDIDLAAVDFFDDIAGVVRRVREIVARDVDDGLAFDSATVGGERIREDAAYAGVRVRMVATMASARIPLHVDVNFGDPIWPAPAEAELPLLLGGTLRLRGYPDHMVLAEKIVTAVDRGDLNTRWRDFTDIAAITATRVVSFDDLRAALVAVADHRGVVLLPLTPLLDRMPDLSQTRWAAWRRKQRLDETTPERFADLLESCRRFADPVLDPPSPLTEWNPSARCWESHRPTRRPGTPE